MPHSKFFILHFFIFNFFYSRLLASSLSSLRSPFTRFTCAKIFWSFIRSIIYTRPLDWLSRYGWSICWISPVNTIFVPSPARVMMVFISFGVRFCASSMIIHFAQAAATYKCQSLNDQLFTFLHIFYTLHFSRVGSKLAFYHVQVVE